MDTECSVVTQSLPHTHHRTPLQANSMNNINPQLASPKKQTSVKNQTSPTRDLPKQYLELAARLEAVTRNYTHLEDELTKKTHLVQELAEKVSGSERVIRSLEEERHKNNDLFQREITYYKESVEELQRRNKRMSFKLELGVQQATSEADIKYAQLMKNYRVLQSSLELEQNLRALLIDQIEFLTKERDFLLENASTQVENHYHGNYVNHLYGDSDSDGSVHATRLLDSLVEGMEDIDDMDDMEQLETSSLTKNLNSSLDVVQNFQFPASKRHLLPAKIKSPVVGDEPFVLSPLKLTGNFDTSQPDIKKRYLLTKPHHSRYNSHDIVPIKVEFEELDERSKAVPGKQLRSISEPNKQLSNTSAVDKQMSNVPDNDFLCREIVEEEEDSRQKAFLKLHGLESKHNSIGSSSKRLSLITDFSTLGDVTKQEIMKLKFELQSLKLHNEKLLSYIGFELQKQKKNIKKLSSNQNLNMEYSDAKLIEKLRDMLIHKKRVLRAVSINPILSSKYDMHRKSSILQPGAATGYLNDDDDDFVFQSPFVNLDDCDDYGFLNHESKYNLRVFLTKNQVYLNEKDIKVPKKYKSQTFASMDIDDTSYMDVSLLDGVDDDEWQLCSDHGSVSSDTSEVVYSNLNTFNQIRYLFFGKDHLRKKNDTLVDENLKYKFLTIVIGIVIVGIKFTNHLPQPLLA